MRILRPNDYVLGFKLNKPSELNAIAINGNALRLACRKFLMDKSFVILRKTPNGGDVDHADEQHGRQADIRAGDYLEFESEERHQIANSSDSNLALMCLRKQ